jgi:hypothetical protein
VLLVVVAQILPITCFSHVAPLVSFGLLFVLGLTSRQQMRTTSQIILFSSHFQQVISVLGGLFCNLFGLLVSGSFGMKEI